MTVDIQAVPAPRSARFRVRDTESEMTTAKAPVVPAPVKKIPANSNKKLDFKTNDHVVYPTHGVGRILRVEEQEVAGIKLELFVITFDKDKMTLRVPTTKAKAVGMRKLSSPDTVATALNTLKGRARIKRTMWSRRAQEYEAKINSGDLVSIAEVVRDLHRASGQPEQSYSERQLYEAALARMAREVAAVEKIDETAAVKRVEGALLKKAA
jgi:CarD family transcriptional regulator